MKSKIFSFVAAVVAVASLVSLSHAQVESEDGVAQIVAVRAANRAMREMNSRSNMHRSASSSGLAARKGGPNYTGFWAGRYLRFNSTCNAFPLSFLFRHVLYQSGAGASLQTTHDGNFFGVSRDKGRRLEFSKRVNFANGLSCNVAVLYKDLANNGRASGTGYGISCNNGCSAGYGGNAIRN